MSSADEWRRVCDGLGGADQSETGALFKALYALARQTGIAHLRRLWSYSEDDALEVVHEVLAARWNEIVAAEESPKALFLRMLVHRAIDRHRRRKREDELPLDPVPVPSQPTSPTISLELGRVLLFLQGELSPRDLRVFSARCLGATSKEVAEAERLSPANVDQIVSRARARLKELLDADPE